MTERHPRFPPFIHVPSPLIQSFLFTNFLIGVLRGTGVQSLKEEERERERAWGGREREKQGERARERERDMSKGEGEER